MTAAHLGDDTIAAMLEGGLPDERAAVARDHIASCDACRRLVSAAIDAAPSQSQSWRDGVIAGRYRVEHPLGEGGMGRVYAARQVGLERPVAIKILRPELARDTVALRRFQREARLVAQLASPHVVRVHDLGTLDSGEPYLVMELLDGEDLATVLARGPVPVDRATAWIAAACDALAEAHALGIVHRDVKPSNMIVTRQGRLVVVDFGLAKLAAPAGASAAVTAEGLVLGSPHYMAPEQVRGARDVDARADIWSLGATLYHLVTSEPPFPAATLQDVFGSILSGRLPPLDAVPPPIAAAIRRAMALAPAARFASARELAAALRTPLPSIDRYEILELLGEGSHGAVYRARQLPGGREVALKVLRAEAARLRERFAREAAIVQRLEHPNTVRLFEYGIGADAPYMVFELVRGRTLAAEIARGALPAERVARIATQVLKALMEAHAHGIVHRDVTPANILLVDHAGEPDFVRLFDFGVASDGGGSAALTGTGQLVGTPRYMAPEQVSGGAAVDPRTDLYALGLVMAEALAGAPIYAGESAMAVCVEQASPAPVPLPHAVTASPLGAIIARATAKLPHARYRSAREMFDALEGTGSGSRPAPGPKVSVQRSPTAIRNLVLALAGIVVVGIVGYIVGVSTSSSSEPVAAPLAAAPGSATPGSATNPSPPPPPATPAPADAAVSAPADAAIAKKPAADATTAGVQIGTRGPVEIGTRGHVEIGGKGPVVLGPNVVIKDRPPPATASQKTGGNGPLGNFDENRLRKRLVKLGWKPAETWHENIAGCEHTRILSYLGDDKRTWADTTLLTCESREIAASEGARLRRMPIPGWVVDDANLVLDVSTNNTVGADEAKSKALFDQLVVP